MNILLHHQQQMQLKYVHNQYLSEQARFERVICIEVLEQNPKSFTALGLTRAV